MKKPHGKSTNKKALGKNGEELAVHYLKNEGFRILETNWIYRHKEIDIIAETEGFLVIVEVKSRNINFLETPGEMINRKKQQFLIEAAEAYIFQYNIEKETRFDVIIIVFDHQRSTITHIDDAFQPGFI